MRYESVSKAVELPNVAEWQARLRLVKRKEELEELLQDMEQRLDDGEAQIAAATAEKKRLLTNCQDLEEQYVHIVIVGRSAGGLRRIVSHSESVY